MHMYYIKIHQLSLMFGNVDIVIIYIALVLTVVLFLNNIDFNELLNIQSFWEEIFKTVVAACSSLQ